MLSQFKQFSLISYFRIEKIGSKSVAYCKTRKYGSLQISVPLVQLPSSAKIYSAPMVFNMFQNYHFGHFFITGNVPYRNFGRSILVVYTIAHVNCLGNRVSENVTNCGDFPRCQYMIIKYFFWGGVNS